LKESINLSRGVKSGPLRKEKKMKKTSWENSSLSSAFDLRSSPLLQLMKKKVSGVE
jgi:hypothetical protein